MQKSINTLRMLGIEMVNKANSGHPGIVLGAAPIVYTIFTKHLNINPFKKDWINRDRFILSVGHGSALLYATLYLSKMGFSLEDLKNFRQVDSITPGHPEYNLSYGIENTSGPLGQGIGIAVGSAIAEASLNARFKDKGESYIDHYTYCLCGDGDLQEGVSQEAIEIAGRLKLNKLVVLYDSNDVQLDSDTSLTTNIDFKKRMEAAHWDYFLVKEGDNVSDINKAIVEAKKSEQPAMIEIKTIIGEGATAQGTSKVHGAALGPDIDNVKKYYNWIFKDFEVPQEVWEDFKINTIQRGKKHYENWFKKFKDFELPKFEMPSIQKNLIPTDPEASRVSVGKVLDYVSRNNIRLIGGSCDLSSSTKAKGADGEFLPGHYRGRNINFGVRDFAMASINNGITLHGGLESFVGDFLVFVDYLKPAIRLSSLMKLSNLYIMSHDSILLGEDGPTHQPIEQLAMLRSQPNLHVYRPADFKEAWGVFQSHYKYLNTPSVIVTSRQNLNQNKSTSSDKVIYGAYEVLKPNKSSSDIIITATGSEVELALKTAKILKQEYNYQVKVISMVCREVFEKQTEKYQRELYENHKPVTVTMELASTFGWSKYGSINIGLDQFGFSGKYQDIIKKINLTPEKQAKYISQKIKK